MPRPQNNLGDSHNFGRRVSLQDDRIVKPRTVLWEWLLLAGESPLRQLLATAGLQDGLGREAFAFLPTLKFFPSNEPVGGIVERVRLDPLGELSIEGRRSLAQIVGRSIALWTWLGVSDLHWENLVLGVDDHGQVVFAPLDIEMILADLSLPTETKLLPDADPEYAAICRHACGVRRVLPYLLKPVRPADLLAMAGAYRGTLEFLDRHARAISEVFAALPAMAETPIRVCLRGTGEYVHASPSLWPPLLDAEAEQLERGDIPYFFRLYGRPGIHYYVDPQLATFSTLPLYGDVPQLDPMLQVSCGLQAPSRKQLREDGLFAVIAAFDDPLFDGLHRCDDLALRFSARSIVVTLPNGEELHAGRDLSAVVGSVYLPCRCGEVRSVFVPPVTVCEAQQGTRRDSSVRTPKRRGKR